MDDDPPMTCIRWTLWLSDRMSDDPSCLLNCVDEMERPGSMGRRAFADSGRFCNSIQSSCLSATGLHQGASLNTEDVRFARAKVQPPKSPHPFHQQCSTETS